MNIKDIMEIIFNIAYLIVIYIVVFKMYNNINNLDGKNIKLSKNIAKAFALLALGDTGHVGFRVIAYLNGGIEDNAVFVGYGKLASAITVTIFYMLLVKVWKIRYDKKESWFTYLLYSSGLIRIVIMLLPGNEWVSLTTPFNWSMYRNIPLFILGIGVTYLFMRDAIKVKDRTFCWISIMIIISYVFYTPVILFARKLPIIGMLMIPKTLAYLAAAFIFYNRIFKQNEKQQTSNLKV